LHSAHRRVGIERHFLNTSREAIETLGITHLRVRRKGESPDWFSRHDWSYWTFKNMFPRATAHAKPIQSYKLWDGYRVDLRTVGCLQRMLATIMSCDLNKFASSARQPDDATLIEQVRSLGCID